MRKVREDSPEQIQKCLSCPKPKCCNCAEHSSKEPTAPKTRGKPVIAYAEGKEELRFDNASRAAEAMFVTQAAISLAVRKGSICQGYYWRYA